MKFIQFIINFISSLFGVKPKNQEKVKKVESTNKPTIAIPKVEPKKEQAQSDKPETIKLPSMAITEEVMKQALYLGHFDNNSISRQKIEPSLKTYHKRILDNFWEGNKKMNKEDIEKKLRHGDIFSWVDLKPLEGNAVKTLQTFLIQVGIFPGSASIDGFFGYSTQAGVRLFQEYERTQGNKAKSIPNGVVDETTWKAMKEWQVKGKKAVKWTRGQPSVEFNKWIQMLEKARSHYLHEPNLIIDKINKKVEHLNKAGNGSAIDTLKIQDWKFNPNDTHLIGIRRHEDDPGKARINDDLFILLINGMVFKFWGSTDPRQSSRKVLKDEVLIETVRQDEAFLVEGQHKFRFGWHKIANDEKLYQGLNPYDRGVLVFRDDKSINDNRLTEADIEKGIDNKPNKTINIHWTGIGSDGRKTWSAGCQVMAAKSYIDNEGKERDCSSFLFSNYNEGGKQKEDKISKTKGAYNMFTDLVLCYQPKKVDYIFYTLGRDDSLKIDDSIMQEGDKIVSDSLGMFNIPHSKIKV